MVIVGFALIKIIIMALCYWQSFSIGVQCLCSTKSPRQRQSNRLNLALGDDAWVGSEIPKINVVMRDSSPHYKDATQQSLTVGIPHIPHPEQSFFFFSRGQYQSILSYFFFWKIIKSRLDNRYTQMQYWQNTKNRLSLVRFQMIGGESMKSFILGDPGWVTDPAQPLHPRR